mmetsp:Transcript_21627/g.20916  ORF Transcript_21627/g.20916 Transcript_21627/m.20916 type:complete len:153 (+) Transcript_21627:60-518(+)
MISRISRSWVHPTCIRSSLAHLSTVAAPVEVAAAPRARAPRPPPITVTDRATTRIKEMIEDKEDVLGVKINVKRRGCNGYSYTMNYASIEDINSKKNESVVTNDITVLVDPQATFYIAGTVMDFEETELSSEFTFKNPNSKGSCGCGESFNL